MFETQQCVVTVEGGGGMSYLGGFEMEESLKIKIMSGTDCWLKPNHCAEMAT